MKIFLIRLIFSAMLIAPLASQAEQQFGGCVDRPRVCFGPSATLHLLQWNLSAGKLAAGFIPGAGYGATWAPDAWYAAGLHLYLTTIVGGDKPSHVTPSLVASFANYARVGLGAEIVVNDGPAKAQWLLLLGIGSDFGGSPRYVQETLR